MRIMDAVMAFPGLLLAIALMAALGASLTNVCIALAIRYTPNFARLVRASVLKEREKEYVEAAMVQGESNLRVLFRQILPNCMAPVLVQATLDFAHAIIAEASLRFPGHRRAAAHAELGQHPARGPIHHGGSTLGRPSSRGGHLLLRAGSQPSRRRSARRAGPAFERGEVQCLSRSWTSGDWRPVSFSARESSPRWTGCRSSSRSGQTLGIVGETGSGEERARAVAHAAGPAAAREITNGEVLFKGEDLLTKTEPEMRSYRGSRISMIFQNPWWH